MRALEQKILQEGKVLPGNILKVGSFLNHQIDTGFILEIGQEIAKIYSDREVTKILTIEASGIAIGMGVGVAMQLPIVFAKKNKHANISGDVYKTRVHSYTHNTEYTVILSKDFLGPEDKVVIVDDFLANGKALMGLIDIVKQSGATLVGCSCVIEKGFQGGGDALRKMGVRVESLAIIESMDNDSVTFRR